MEIASVGPWRIVPRAKIAKRGELACRLRGAAPSLAKELQGDGRGRGKGKERRVGALGALPLGRRCFAARDVLAAFWDLAEVPCE